MRFVSSLYLIAGGLFIANVLVAQEEPEFQPIEIAEITREEPVSFAKEIYPLLKKNCIACHNSSSAKAKLNLETPEAMVAGGNEGPAIVPGKSEESLLLLLASHQDEPIMPPDRNRSNAVPFLPEELGLIKRWIDEGAKGEMVAAVEAPTEWRHPSIENQPIYQAAISSNARFAAAARANRVHLYDLNRGERSESLGDPELAQDPIYKGEPVAHRDFVQSLAFSPTGWLATGGYRNVKLWKRSEPEKSSLPPMPDVVSSMAVAPDGQWTAMGDRAGNVRVSRAGQASEAIWNVKEHEGEITGLAFTPDGQRLISGSRDHKICVWKLDSGRRETVLLNPGPVSSIVLLIGREQIAAGCDDGTVQLWSMPTEGEAVPDSPEDSMKVHESVAAMSPVGAGNLLLTGGGEGHLKLWNVDAQEIVRTMDHGAPIAEVAASADGKRLASIGGAGGKLWNGESGELIRELAADPPLLAKHQAAHRQVEVAAKVTALRKTRITEAEAAWNAEVEKAKQAAIAAEKARSSQDPQALGRHEAALALQSAKDQVEANEADLAADQAGLVESEGGLNGMDGRIAELRDRVQAILAQKDVELAAAREQLQAGAAKVAQAEAEVLSQDQKKAELAAILDRLAEVGKEAAPFESMDEALTAVGKLKVEIEGRYAAVVSAKEAVLQENEAISQTLARLEEERRISEQPLIEIREEKESLLAEIERRRQSIQESEAKRESLAAAVKAAEEKLTAQQAEVAKGRKLVADADQNADLAVRLAATAGEVHAKALAALAEAEAAEVARQAALDLAAQALAGAKPLVEVAFSPDSQTLAAASSGSIVTWTAQDGDTLDRFSEGELAPTELAFDAQGSLLTAFEDKTTQAWSPSAKWELERAIGAINDPSILIDRVTSLAFDPQGTLLATGGGSPSRGGELKVWHVADGTLVFANDEAHTDTITDMAFSPDGEWLATAGTDRMVRVWRVTSGELVTTFEGHVNHVLGVSWRADGQVLASCGADKVIKLWDFEKRVQVGTVEGFGREITSVQFVSTGETLLSGAGDSAVRLGEQRLETGFYVHSTAISDDASRLVAGSQDGVLRVWRASDRQLIYEFNE